MNPQPNMPAIVTKENNTMKPLILTMLLCAASAYADTNDSAAVQFGAEFVMPRVNPKPVATTTKGVTLDDVFNEPSKPKSQLVDLDELERQARVDAYHKKKQPASPSPTPRRTYYAPPVEIDIEDDDDEPSYTTRSAPPEPDYAQPAPAYRPKPSRAESYEPSLSDQIDALLTHERQRDEPLPQKPPNYWSSSSRSASYDNAYQSPPAPIKLNAYGAGVNSDVYGRPQTYRTKDGAALPVTAQDGVKRDAYGAGVHADQYGRPVHDGSWP